MFNGPNPYLLVFIKILWFCLYTPKLKDVQLLNTVIHRLANIFYKEPKNKYFGPANHMVPVSTTNLSL
jgi:hypothetical protein